MLSLAGCFTKSIIVMPGKSKKFSFKLNVPQCLVGMDLEESCRATAAWVAAAVERWYPKTTSDRPFNGLFGYLASVSPDAHSLKVLRRVEEHYEKIDGPGGIREIDKRGEDCSSMAAEIFTLSPLERMTRDSQLDEIRSSWTRACQISRTLYDLTEYMAYKGKPEWGRVLLRYFLLDLYCFSIETLKYHTLWLGNLVKKEITKRKPSVEGIDGLLIDGAYRRFCLQKLRKPGRRAWILSDTFHMGLKRGFPSMKDIEVSDALRDYQLSLSREKELDQETEDQIRRTALEVFGDLYPCYDQYPVSLSATLSYTRKEYGMRGFVVSSLYRSSLPLQNLCYAAMLKAGDISVLGGYEQNKTCVREYRVEPEVDFMEAYMSFINSTKGSLDRFLHSRVAVVREPLKVRPITAGDEEHYVLLKPFQMSMWRSLQRFDQFKLTGEEFREEHLERLTKIPKKFGSAAYFLDAFISGDYSQATNDLCAAATRVVWETAWGSEYWEIVGPALNPHIIHSNGTAFLQKNGQLMGSPISFPVLCCINAAIGRWSYEKWIKQVTGNDVSVSIRDCPMLVNGDDFAATSTVEHNIIWKDLVKRVGWTLSPGKSYFSREFVQINSRTCPVQWWGYESVFELNDEFHIINDCEVSPVGDWCVWWDRNEQFQIEYKQVGYDLHCSFDRMIPFVNFGFLEMMSKDTIQLDQPINGTVTVGWEGRLRWVRKDPYWDRQYKILRRNFFNQYQTFLVDHKLGRSDVDPDLSTKHGGLSLNPRCTCLSGPCSPCTLRIAECKPRFAFQGIRTANFAGLNENERPDDSFRLRPWSESVEWKRPPNGTVERSRSCSDVFSLYIPGISAENETMPSCSSERNEVEGV